MEESPMERREVLKCGMALSAALLVERLVEPAAMAAPPAAGVPAAFFEGAFPSGDFAGWLVSLVVTGRRVQGMAYDPATVDRTAEDGTFEELEGVRLQGNLRN